jgi:hypothetical protein
MGEDVSQVVCLRPFLRPPFTQPFAARWSDTKPRVRSEIKNRASAAPFPPFASVTVLAFTGSSLHSAHGSLSPPIVKRAAYGRVTDSGFKKKL